MLYRLLTLDIQIPGLQEVTVTASGQLYEHDTASSAMRLV